MNTKQQAAELQRDYDRYRERHGLPLAPVGEVSREEFDAWLAEDEELYNALMENNRRQIELNRAVAAQFAAAAATLGPDPHRRVCDVATEAQHDQMRALAEEGQRLSRALGLPVRSGVNEDGEPWVIVPRRSS